MLNPKHSSSDVINYFLSFTNASLSLTAYVFIKFVLNLSKQIYSAGERFKLKIHQNNQLFLHC